MAFHACLRRRGMHFGIMPSLVQGCMHGWKQRTTLGSQVQHDSYEDSRFCAVRFRDERLAARFGRCNEPSGQRVGSCSPEFDPVSKVAIHLAEVGGAAWDPHQREEVKQPSVGSSPVGSSLVSSLWYYLLLCAR